MATESDNVNSGALGTLVAVGTFAMLGISLVVTALVRSEMADEVQKKEVSADRAYRDLVAEQRAQLQAPAAYKDRASGSVSLPIDRAMELVVAGLAKDPNSATPPAPVGGSAGAAAEAAGSGGLGGLGGMSGAGGNAGAGGAASAEGAKPPGDEPKPAENLKKEPVPEKKEAPKPTPAPGVPGSPAAPAPVNPTPAPAAPSPAPNGQ